MGYLAWIRVFEFFHEEPAGPTPWWSLLLPLFIVLALVCLTLSAVGFAGRRLLLRQVTREAWSQGAADGLAASFLICPALLVAEILARAVASCSFRAGC